MSKDIKEMLKLYSKEDLWNRIQEQQAKVYALKAKLAESESKLRVSNSSLASSQLEYDKLKKEYDEQEKLLSQYLASNSRLQFEYDQLKQQLAEKEKENKRLKFDLAMYRSANELINRFGIEKARDVMFQTEKTKKQGQIDYAVEQLERLRELALNHIREIANDFSEDADERLNQRHTIHGCSTVITDINQLITEIKEGK